MKRIFSIPSSAHSILNRERGRNRRMFFSFDLNRGNEASFELISSPMKGRKIEGGKKIGLDPIFGAVGH